MGMAALVRPSTRASVDSCQLVTKNAPEQAAHGLVRVRFLPHGHWLDKFPAGPLEQLRNAIQSAAEPNPSGTIVNAIRQE